MQEAKRKNITATSAEIKKAIAGIEQQNNMKPGQLDQVLKSNGIEPDALIQQVTASIVWAKLVRQLAVDTDPVSDAEVDETLKRLKQDQNEPQSRVAEIFLPVDNPRRMIASPGLGRTADRADEAGRAVFRGGPAILAISDRRGRRRYRLDPA